MRECTCDWRDHNFDGMLPEEVEDLEDGGEDVICWFCGGRLTYQQWQDWQERQAWQERLEQHRERARARRKGRKV